jgi:hypothetical protein
MKKHNIPTIRSKRIGKVSVNLDTPPTREELKELLAIAGHSKEEIKSLVHGSKLYGTVPAKAKPSAVDKQPYKDSK